MEVVSGNNWSYKTCKAPVKSSPPTSNVLQARCPSCHPSNSVRALKVEHATTPLCNTLPLICNIRVTNACLSWNQGQLNGFLTQERLHLLDCLCRLLVALRSNASQPTCWWSSASECKADTAYLQILWNSLTVSLPSINSDVCARVGQTSDITKLISATATSSQFMSVINSVRLSIRYTAYINW